MLDIYWVYVTLHTLHILCMFHEYIILYKYYTWYKHNCGIMIYQVHELNKKISAASKDKTSPLFNVPPVRDPSNEIAQVLVEALEWSMLSREWNVSTDDLAALHKKSQNLLYLLQTHLPDRIGGAPGWNFEKAHSIQG